MELLSGERSGEKVKDQNGDQCKQGTLTLDSRDEYLLKKSDLSIVMNSGAWYMWWISFMKRMFFYEENVTFRIKYAYFYVCACVLKYLFKEACLYILQIASCRFDMI